MHYSGSPPELGTVRDLLKRLGWKAKARRKKSDDAENVREFWDTFDGLLMTKGMVLFQESATGQWTLSSLENTHKVLAQSEPKQTLQQCLEHPAMKPLIQPVIKPRTLLLRASIKHQCQRLLFEHQQNGSLMAERVDVLGQSDLITDTSWQPISRFWYLEAMQGEERLFERTLQEIQQKLGGDIKALAFDDFPDLMRVLNLPQNHSKPHKLYYQGTHSFADCALTILQFYRNIMEFNQQGTIDSLDIEFLHDYRVALRHIRSLLPLFRPAFTQGALDLLRERLRWLGQITGPLRDVDVALEDFGMLYELVSPKEHPALEIYREYLLQVQATEQQQLKDHLTSPACQELMDYFDHTLVGLKTSELGETPMREVATSLINKALRKVIKAGNRIHDESPNEDYHELRILCKKLRYTLDCLKPLFPEEIDRFVLEMKKLQDILGRFQDANVHEEKLRQDLKLISQKKFDESLFLAMGQVIGAYGTKREKARREFESVFDQFSSSANLQLLKKLATHSKSI